MQTFKRRLINAHLVCRGVEVQHVIYKREFVCHLVFLLPSQILRGQLTTTGRTRIVFVGVPLQIKKALTAVTARASFENLTRLLTLISGKDIVSHRQTKGQTCTVP